VLDPTGAGKDANDLEIGLRRKIVGQDKAIFSALYASVILRHGYPFLSKTNFQIGDLGEPLKWFSCG
jgi:hypothetical protein